MSCSPARDQLNVDTLGDLSFRHVRTAEEKEPPLHFETRTTAALLVFLACQGRPFARDPLAELLWPGRSQEQARTNLRGCTHRLRQQVGSFLEITRNSIALNSAAAVCVDCLAFEECLRAGRPAEAIALYQGDFLEGFYLDGSPAFEQWMLMERERLHNLALLAFQQLIAQATATGQPELAIDYTIRLLRLDPLNEPIHRLLMRLYTQTNRRAAALHQYAVCCRFLDAELGVPPDQATTALYEQIRAGAPVGAADSPGGVNAAAAQPALISPAARGAVAP